MDNDPKGLAQRPLKPSRTKIGRERRVLGVEWTAPTTNPIENTVGTDVSDWYSVLVTVHPSLPAFDNANVENAYIRLRVWRWRDRAGYGTGHPDGQWYADEDLWLGLDGNPTWVGPMEWMLATKNAEKIYLQVVEFDFPNYVGDPQVEIGLYGIGEKRESGMDPTPYIGHGNPVPDPIPILTALGAHPLQDAMLSNLAGDFTATRTAATTIRCVGTFEIAATTWMTASKVIAVGWKPAAAGIGNESEFTILSRGGGLNCSVTVVDATTFDIFVDPGVLGATDNILVWIAGPRHRYEVLGIDGYKRQRTRDEAFDVAEVANRIKEIDPLDQRYVPDILADADTVAQATTVDFYLDMAGYRFLTIQWIPSDANFTLTVDATNKDNGTAPAVCDYIDVTNAWFGSASFTATCFLFLNVHTFVKYVHIEIVRAAEAGNGTHKLYVRRGW